VRIEGSSLVETGTPGVAPGPGPIAGGALSHAGNAVATDEAEEDGTSEAGADGVVGSGGAVAAATTSTGGTRIGLSPGFASRYLFARFAVSFETGRERPLGLLRSSAAVSIAVPIRHISLRWS